MKKLNLSKLIIITLIIVILAMGSIILSSKSFKSQQTPNEVTQVVNDSTGIFDKIFSSPGRFLREKYTDANNFLDTYKENRDLKKELYELEEEVSKTDILTAENKALKEALNLQGDLIDFKKFSANVITRNPSTWEDVLVIDAGSNDGVKDNMIVMSNGGIVGRVSQVNKKTSKVSLLTGVQGMDNKLPVRVGNTDTPSYGLVSSYDTKKNAYVVSQITSKTEIKVGDKVVTSGLGGDSPQNLLVGTVKEKKNNSNSSGQEVYVEPASDFYDIRVVTLVDRMDGVVNEEE